MFQRRSLAHLLTAAAVLMSVGIFFLDEMFFTFPIGILYCVPMVIFSMYYGYMAAVLCAFAGAGLTYLANPDFFDASSVGLSATTVLIYFIALLSIGLVARLVTERQVAVEKLATEQAMKEKRLIEQQQATLRGTVEELARVNQELVAVSQHKDRILSATAHDLRNPASTIIAFNDLLERHIDNEEKIKHYCDRIRLQSGQLMSLIDDLMDLSVARGQLFLQPISMDRMLEEEAESFRAREQRHPLTLRLSPDLPALSVDSARLHRVLTNLLDNAAKYSPDDAEIILSAEQQGDMLNIGVTDHGAGIAPQEHADIFIPFYRSATHLKTTKGNGLGLSIAKEIIENHGGTITLDSEPGHGATFTIHLPVTPADVTAQHPSALFSNVITAIETLSTPSTS